MHLEGRLSILAALTTGRRRVAQVLVSRDAKPEKVAGVLEAARARHVPVRKVEAGELDRLAHGKTHGGLVAVCDARAPDDEAALGRILDRERSPLLLMLEGADDARNLGSVLRTAEALGVHAVLVRKREWDFDETDVMRASSGAFERLCVVRFDHEDGLTARLKSRGLAILACVPNVMGTIYEADLARPVVLAVGGEKRGLSGTLRGECTGFVRIPMKAGATSLTMQDAAAIIVAEAMRQRSSTTR